MKNKRPTKIQKEIAKEDGWGDFEINHGYGVFSNQEPFGINDLEVINRIDIMGTFDDDKEATEQAKKDGFNFLFTNVLDTPSNRTKTKNYSRSQREEWF